MNAAVKRILREALFENGTDKDVTRSISSAFLKYSRNDLENISINFVPSLKPDELEWAFDLCKGNMEEIYDHSGYGWDDDDKMSELTEQGARFLLLRDESLDDKPLIGFVHFRFTIQGEILEKMVGSPILCVWDIHIEADYQRKGLGKHLFVILELIARQQKMESVSIPVQDKDTTTFSWITKIKGYEPDTQLKSLIGFDSELEGFQIYAKNFKSAGKENVKAPIKAVTNKLLTSPVSVFEVPCISPASIDNKALPLSTSNNLDVVPMIRIDDDNTVPLSIALDQLKECYRSKNNNQEPSQEMVDAWLQTLQTSICNENVDVAKSSEEDISEVDGFQFININDVPKF